MNTKIEEQFEEYLRSLDSSVFFSQNFQPKSSFGIKVLDFSATEWAARVEEDDYAWDVSGDSWNDAQGAIGYSYIEEFQPSDTDQRQVNTLVDQRIEEIYKKGEILLGDYLADMALSDALESLVLVCRARLICGTKCQEIEAFWETLQNGLLVVGWEGDYPEGCFVACKFR